jgi:hypothetical protein
MSKRAIRWFVSVALTAYADRAYSANVLPDDNAKVAAAEMVAESADCYA